MVWELGRLTGQQFALGDWDIPLSHLTPSLAATSCDYVDESYIVKSYINCAIHREDDIILCSFVLTQYQRGQTDGRTDGRTDRQKCYS